MTEVPNDASDLPTETAPPNLPINSYDFQFPDEAREIAYAVGFAVRAISQAIDLERLDGITIAFDYAAALAAIDRGYPNAKITTSTRTSEIVGVAMSVNVLRDTMLKSHIVFHAGVILPLLGNDNITVAQAVSLIAHECAPRG